MWVCYNKPIHFYEDLFYQDALLCFGQKHPLCILLKHINLKGKHVIQII